jgi:hypothetical protein
VRLRERAARVSPDTWALVAIVAAVLLANLLYLVGLVVANPLGPRSGLLSSIASGPFPGQSALDPNNGFVAQAVGHRAALDWLHLSIPWWNPYEGTGAPLIGEMQSAAMFPLTLLTALSNGQLYEHILLELIAGVSTCLLLRRLSLSPFAAAAGGIAFALNGTFAWFGHAPVNPVAFLPLLLLGAEQAYAAALAGRAGGWWLIAISGALSLYAGFPEVAYIDVLLAICWFAWRGGCLPRSSRRAFALKALSGAIVAVLLSAPQLVAFVDFLAHADVGKHSLSLSGLHPPAQSWSQLILPYVYGPLFAFVDPHFTMLKVWGNAGGYLTTSLLLFALLGLFSRARKGLRLILIAWIVIALARVFGQPPLLGAVFSLLPGMSHVVFDRYAAPSIELAVIVLAALGLDQALSLPVPRRLFRAAAAVIVAVIVGAIGAASLASELGAANAHRWFFWGSIAWGMAIAIAAAAVMLLHNARLRALLATALVAGDAMLLFAIPQLSAPREVAIDTAPVQFLRQHLGTSRFFTLGPLQPNYGAYYGLASLNINDLPIPSLDADYTRAHLDKFVNPAVLVGNYGGGRSLTAPPPTLELFANLAGYREAAVKYVLVPAGQSLPQGPHRVELVFRGPSTWIYRLTGAEPYFSVNGPGCTATASSQSAVRVTCSHPTTLVRRETSMPGWSAEVDGRSAPVLEHDGVFQAVSLGAGSHSVTFSFTPPDEGLGLLGLLAGIGWLATGALLTTRRRRRSGPGYR